MTWHDLGCVNRTYVTDEVIGRYFFLHVECYISVTMVNTRNVKSRRNVKAFVTGGHESIL